MATFYAKKVQFRKNTLKITRKIAKTTYKYETQQINFQAQLLDLKHKNRKI